MFVYAKAVPILPQLQRVSKYRGHKKILCITFLLHFWRCAGGKNTAQQCRANSLMLTMVPLTWTKCDVLTVNSPPVTIKAERRLTSTIATNYLSCLLIAVATALWSRKRCVGRDFIIWTKAHQNLFRYTGKCSFTQNHRQHQAVCTTLTIHQPVAPKP